MNTHDFANRIEGLEGQALVNAIEKEIQKYSANEVLNTLINIFHISINMIKLFENNCVSFDHRYDIIISLTDIDCELEPLNYLLENYFYDPNKIIFEKDKILIPSVIQCFLHHDIITSQILELIAMYNFLNEEINLKDVLVKAIERNILKQETIDKIITYAVVFNNDMVLDIYTSMNFELHIENFIKLIEEGKILERPISYFPSGKKIYKPNKIQIDINYLTKIIDCLKRHYYISTYNIESAYMRTMMRDKSLMKTMHFLNKLNISFDVMSRNVLKKMDFDDQ